MTRIILVLFALAAIGAASGCLYLKQAKFGRLPQGSRLAALERSPNYADGQFHNREPIGEILKGGSFIGGFAKFLLRSKGRTVPPGPLPVVKTDLAALDPGEDVAVWLGHSSFYLQLGGRTFLIDPVFSAYASPVSLSTRAYEGTSIYSAEDMPRIDYLLITHDHWDHLDYDTVAALRPKIGNVVTGLGVGAHFARWGFPEAMVHEADWDDVVRLEEGVAIHVLTARHFSGRLFTRKKSLWVAFAIETTGRRVFHSGDSGYGAHFAEIGERFGGFDLAFVDSGQYDATWPDVHMIPEQAAQAAEDLRAAAAQPIHAGRFSISYHAWDEPFRRFTQASETRPYHLVTPKIGQPVPLADMNQTYPHWWEEGTPATR